MKNTLTSILAILFVLPAMANMTISGTVVDENGIPLIGASIIPEGTTGIGTTSDLDGNFSFENFPDGKNVSISFIGYETKIAAPSENMQIALEPDEELLQGSTVSAVQSKQCEPRSNEKDVVKNFESQECYVVECVSSRYKLIGTKTAYRNNKLISFDKNSSICENSPCTLVTVGTQCEDQVGQSCDSGDANSKTAKYKWENNTLKCEIKNCVDGYLPNGAGTACEKSEGECSDEQIASIEHATNGELKRGVCHATDCVAGYEPVNGACVVISGNCNPMPENAVSAHRAWDTNSGTEVCIIDSCKDGYSVSNDKKSCITPTLSKEDSEKQIAELQENADAMKEREQSLANRLLGAASIGSVGIGGMQVASALAEQNADSAAERDMSAYLATFKCDYGQGATINGGEYNITLPGANVLLPLYNEYTTLAADLKIRKEALGMTPGIESEVILDAATSGLYDNESTGITDGAYTSLSRALMNPTGSDAAEWAAQQQATASQLQTGATVAGAGALVGIVGNLLINEIGDKPQEISDQIIAKYEPLKKLRDNTAKLPNSENSAQCPSNSTGTYDKCICNDNKYIYNANRNLCEECPGDKVSINNICQCPSGTIPGDNDKCNAQSQNITPQCDTSSEHVKVDEKTGICTCTDGYNLNDDPTPKCVCPSETHEVNSQGNCVKKTTPQTTVVDQAMAQIFQPITISTGNLFELNSYQLTSKAIETLTEFANDVKTAMNGDTNYCINITGHTDKSGSDAINIPLSKNRADAIRNALVSAGLQSSNITTKGVGSSECTSTSQYDVNCRKVEVEFSNTKCGA